MKKSESQLISLISIAGLCGLFIADYFKGGLSGLQGFFLGFFICFIGYLVFSVVFLPKKTKSYQPQEDDRIIKIVIKNTNLDSKDSKIIIETNDIESVKRILGI